MLTRYGAAGWFTGLSGKFLSARTARLLVLAGTERLDKELMIGQMQGKFQLVVMPGVGHMLQEVSPVASPSLKRLSQGTIGRSHPLGRNTCGVLEAQRARHPRSQEGW